MDNPVFCRDGDAHVFGGSANQKICTFFLKNPAKIKRNRCHISGANEHVIYGTVDLRHLQLEHLFFRNSNNLASHFSGHSKQALKFNRISLFTIVP